MQYQEIQHFPAFWMLEPKAWRGGQSKADCGAIIPYDHVLFSIHYQKDAGGDAVWQQLCILDKDQLGPQTDSHAVHSERRLPVLSPPPRNIAHNISKCFQVCKVLLVYFLAETNKPEICYLSLFCRQGE